MKDEKFYWVVASESYTHICNRTLNINVKDKCWFIMDKDEEANIKTKFTVAKYKQWQEKLGFPINLFKKERIGRE